MTKPTTVHITRIGLTSALTVVAICAFRIPGPDGKMYFHLGETVMLTASILLGPIGGAFAGGIASALADLLLGAPVWAPFSFFIHGAECFLVGWLSDALGRTRDFAALFAGAAVMIMGYTLAAGVIYGVVVMPIEFLGDTLQGTLGLATAWPFSRALSRRFPQLMKARPKHKKQKSAK